jgi:hypothetical protein
MGRIATVLLTAAVLVVPQAAAKPGPPSQLLGFVGQNRARAVAKLDALTLLPVSKAVPTGSAQTTYVARSPGRGTRAAFASFPSLRFLDLKKMRWEYRLGYPGVPADSVWTQANRLVTLAATATVVVVDPVKRRLRTIRGLGGSLGAHATTRDRIVAILAPLDGIGPARLAVIDELGRVRIVPLPQIRAGSETLDNGSTFRYEWPALAVEDGGARAVVVSAAGTIVDVGLDTLASAVHATRALASVRKNATGSSRSARWIGSDTIAVSGYDTVFDGREEHSTPAGLTLIDTRDWSSRRIDSNSVELAFNGAVLLAFGNGLAGYDWNGALRFTLFDGAHPLPACIAGSYAYFGSGRHYTIVDTWTGSVVRTVDTGVPTVPVAFSSH